MYLLVLLLTDGKKVDGTEVRGTEYGIPLYQDSFEDVYFIIPGLQRFYGVELLFAVPWVVIKQSCSFRGEPHITFVVFLTLSQYTGKSFRSDE